jgi:hypothetical protein
MLLLLLALLQPTLLALPLVPLLQLQQTLLLVLLTPLLVLLKQPRTPLALLRKLLAPLRTLQRRCNLRLTAKIKRLGAQTSVCAPFLLQA